MRTNKFIKSLGVGIAGVVMFAIFAAPSFAYSSYTSFRYICANEPIPAGYVITENYNDVNCGEINTYTSNARTIEFLTYADTWYEVCSNSPIPQNWAIYDRIYTVQCGAWGSLPNTYKIVRTGYSASEKVARRIGR